MSVGILEPRSSLIKEKRHRGQAQNQYANEGVKAYKEGSVGANFLYYLSPSLLRLWEPCGGVESQVNVHVLAGNHVAARQFSLLG